MRDINLIVVHCSATRVNQDFTVEQLEACHKARGFDTIGYHYYITKDGTLLFDDRADSEEVERVLDGIAAAGFACEALLETTEEPEEAAQEEDVGLTIAVPLDKVQVGNLTKLLDAKGSLIKKALGIDDLRFELEEDRITFPWFAEPQPEEASAYTHFISALCRMSKDAKRITAKEKPVDNEKYAFRCFLLRLGFIGDAYKTDRKILLRNLSGSSAFKSGAKRMEVTDDAVSE